MKNKKKKTGSRKKKRTAKVTPRRRDVGIEIIGFAIDRSRERARQGWGNDYR